MRSHPRPAKVRAAASDWASRSVITRTALGAPGGDGDLEVLLHLGPVRQALRVQPFPLGRGPLGQGRRRGGGLGVTARSASACRLGELLLRRPMCVVDHLLRRAPWPAALCRSASPLASCSSRADSWAASARCLLRLRGRLGDQAVHLLGQLLAGAFPLGIESGSGGSGLGQRLVPAGHGDGRRPPPTGPGSRWPLPRPAGSSAADGRTGSTWTPARGRCGPAAPAACPPHPARRPADRPAPAAADWWRRGRRW